MDSRRLQGKVVVGLVSLLAGGFFVVFSIPSIQPELRASRGEGHVGVFTAVRIRDLGCAGRRSIHTPCWRGGFRSREGGRYLPDVWLAASRRQDLSAGQTRQAIDVGDELQVYPYPYPTATIVIGWVFALLVGVAIMAASLVLMVKSLVKLTRNPAT
jgi:hypothetical protein